MHSSIGEKRIYNSNYLNELGIDNVIKWEIIPLNVGERMIVRFVSTDSSNLQGIRIAVDSGDAFLNFNGEVKKEFWFWENQYMGKDIELVSDANCNVSVYNACFIQKDKSRPGIIRSYTDYAGMIMYTLNDNTFEYHCNDCIKSTDFKNLLFQISIVRG